jgi:hypothetical protein
MLAVVGTLPDPAAPVFEGPARWAGGALAVAGRPVPTDRGTPALLAAACAACAVLGLPEPHAFLAGDEGLGHGSRALYAHLVDVLPGRTYSTLAFHYLMPDTMWHDKVLFAVQAMARRPRLVADAGFMYAAKMSGQAPAYDLYPRRRGTGLSGRRGRAAPLLHPGLPAARGGRRPGACPPGLCRGQRGDLSADQGCGRSGGRCRRGAVPRGRAERDGLWRPWAGTGDNL